MFKNFVFSYFAHSNFLKLSYIGCFLCIYVHIFKCYKNRILVLNLSCLCFRILKSYKNCIFVLQLIYLNLYIFSLFISNLFYRYLISHFSYYSGVSYTGWPVYETAQSLFHTPVASYTGNCRCVRHR